MTRHDDEDDAICMRDDTTAHDEMCGFPFVPPDALRTPTPLSIFTWLKKSRMDIAILSHRLLGSCQPLKMACRL